MVSRKWSQSCICVHGRDGKVRRSQGKNDECIFVIPWAFANILIILAEQFTTQKSAQTDSSNNPINFTLHEIWFKTPFFGNIFFAMIITLNSPYIAMCFTFFFDHRRETPNFILATLLIDIRQIVKCIPLQYKYFYGNYGVMSTTSWQYFFLSVYPSDIQVYREKWNRCK